MQTQIMKLSDIKPAEYNPRVELKRGDTQYEALKNSIEKFGLVEPLVVNSKNNVLIGGHQRLNVLKESGAEEAEVILVDLEEEQEKALNLALNKVSGEWDFDKLEELLKDLDKDDIKFTGFTESEVVGAFDEEYFDDLPEEDPEPQEKEPKEASNEFVVYLSFPSKEKAEEWLEAEGIEKSFGSGKNLTIKMKGIEYD